MKKYIVTYRTLALHNSEIEVKQADADKMRAEIRTKKDHEPLVHGRDWAWVECVRNVTIEADFYSTAQNGTAHFYRHPDHVSKAPGAVPPKDELVVSITAPVTIAIEGDPGVSVPAGTGGRGPVPWGDSQWQFDLWNNSPDPASFLASVISQQREAAERLKRLDEVLESIKAKAGEDWFARKGFPPGTFKSPPEPETPGTDVMLRYRGKDLRVYQQQVRVPHGSSRFFVIDVADEPKPDRGPVLNPLTGKPLGPGEVVA